MDQNKAQHNLDKQTAKILALSSRNIGKYEFWTGEHVLTEKDLLEKNCYKQKIWIFTIRYWVKKRTNWHRKRTKSMIRQGLWI